MLTNNGSLETVLWHVENRELVPELFPLLQLWSLPKSVGKFS
jgi:hypothetical protein